MDSHHRRHLRAKASSHCRQPETKTSSRHQSQQSTLGAALAVERQVIESTHYTCFARELLCRAGRTSRWPLYLEDEAGCEACEQSERDPTHAQLQSPEAAPAFNPQHSIHLLEAMLNTPLNTPLNTACESVTLCIQREGCQHMRVCPLPLTRNPPAARHQSVAIWYCCFSARSSESLLLQRRADSARIWSVALEYT